MPDEYMNRGYLLPEGCKDLNDALKPNVREEFVPAPTTTPMPAVIGEMAITDQTTVCELASALNQKPFRIIADLMQIGVFATVHQPLTFDVIAAVIRGYGYIAKKAG